MLALLRRYTHWLHTCWPAGRVEPLPEVRSDGSTVVPGLWIAGDLTGVPLLKFALDSGARVAQRIADGPTRRQRDAGILDLAIVGAGVAGMAAALEAHRLGLQFAVLEAREPFATVADFPVRKPIFTYPLDMSPAGALQVGATVKEELLAELRRQARDAAIPVTPARVERVVRADGRLEVRMEGGASLAARHVLLAVGRGGDHRALGVPGETLEKVTHRLFDARDFHDRDVLVVGGGDSAVETAVALADAGARVTLSHRGERLVRPKPALLAALAATPGVTPAPATTVREIRPAEVVLTGPAGARALPNDAVFVMIGREPALALLRRSGIAIQGEWSAGRRIGLGLFVAFSAWLMDWKSGGMFSALWTRNRWFPTDLPGLLAGAGGSVAAAAADPRTLLGTLAIGAASPSFWYTLAYTALVTIFGIRRIRARRTPYVTAQTLVLMAVQVLPLFLLPEILLPLLGHNGLLPPAFADALFPVVHYGHGREYWRAYGLVLAWPLDVYNVFTHRPLGAWLAISAAQTLVLIPLGVWAYGKGFYCGWICSCGALAETLGDRQREKMPHGPGWNRLQMAGQFLLAIAVLLLGLRIAGWWMPAGNVLDAAFERVFLERWKWGVDVVLAGVVGYGVYFWYSGRFWCRFFCPLAAWMHVLARFSRFAIVADKKKCISCGVCTRVCHQGIDVMAFAQRGDPMRDPECVRCSACVAGCPTGVLRFGQVRRDGALITLDSLRAAPVVERMDASRGPHATPL